VRTSIRIGCGAGYAGDRIEPAVELAEEGRLDYLVFECLAERTIALAQLRKAHDPDAGYDPLLADRMRAVLPACAAIGVTIVTNMGAANPVAGAAVVRAVARELGLAVLLVLSTQAFNFFRSKAGFADGTPEDLPAPRRERYEQSGRRSRVLVKRLRAEASAGAPA